MNLSTPTVPVFLLSVLLVVLAIAATSIGIPGVSAYAFEIAVFAHLVLIAGNLLKGL